MFFQEAETNKKRSVTKIQILKSIKSSKNAKKKKVNKKLDKIKYKTKLK